MTKDEALKLALEALDHNLLFTSMMPGYDGRIIEKAYKAINKALAQERSSDEQPAQTDWEAVAADQAMTIALLKAEQPSQQEPFAWADLNTLTAQFNSVNCGTAYRLPGEGRQPLYTSSTPCPTCEALARTVMLDQTSHDNQRKWIDLTDEEIIDVLHPLVMADMPDEATDYEIARAIEAKLKEKNT